MTEPLPAVHIARTIRDVDCIALRRLLTRYPEETTAYTWFRAQTWMGYAAGKGNIRILQTLLDAGCDPSVGDAREQATPLCSAAQHGHADAVAWLLAQGVPLDTRLPVRNPLFSSIIGKSPECAKLILDAGIDCDVRYESPSPALAAEVEATGSLAAKLRYMHPSMRDMDAAAFAFMRQQDVMGRTICERQAQGDSAKLVALVADAKRRGEANIWQPGIDRIKL